MESFFLLTKFNMWDSRFFLIFCFPLYHCLKETASLLGILFKQLFVISPTAGFMLLPFGFSACAPKF